MEKDNTTKMKWDNAYSIGIEEIDHQHKYFFLLINRLGEMLKKNEKRLLIQNTIEELVKYTHFHFKSEENLMEENSYPNSEEHKPLHINLINELSNKIAMYENNAIPLNDIVEFLFNWLVEHTTGEDIKFGKFINRKG